MIRRRTFRHLLVPAAAATLVLAGGGAAPAAGPLQSQAYLPSQCGEYAGALVWNLGPIVVNDHSAGITALTGPASTGGYYVVPDPAVAGTITITIGTAFDDQIVGTSGNDVICAWEGNDTVQGVEGNDTLYGHIGIDNLFGQGGSDYIDGGPDNDALFGDSLGLPTPTDGPDTLRGATGTDILHGGAGVDEMHGGPNPSGYPDFGDGQTDGATCFGIEDGPALNTTAGTC